MGYVAKFLTALAAALAVLINSLPDGLTAAEWRNVAATFIGAALVYAVPNARRVLSPPTSRPPGP